MDRIGTNLSNMKSEDKDLNKESFLEVLSILNDEREKIKQGGGALAIEKQHKKKRLTARERIDTIIDTNSNFFEIGIYAGWKMYEEYGSVPSGGIITGFGIIENKECMIIANDATVKAGAYFEITLKKTLRAQQIAMENNIPIIYLVDSAGVFLPLQNQVFPDEGHFGRIFYNNAKISAKGICQIAIVMGPCVAGGAYLPVMCDKYIIVEGASMFLAGPALVKAAIGQEIDQETLGGAMTHSSISGTADYHEKDDLSALNKAREIIKLMNMKSSNLFIKHDSQDPEYESDQLISIFNAKQPSQYNIKEVISRLTDESNFNEFKKNYGKTIVCGTARIGGYNVGIVANQRLIKKNHQGNIQLGGVIYSDSSDKAARFIMNCNQDRLPIIFIHDVNGFMVGKDSEWGGIAKDGAKMVNAVSNSTVPKITLVIGGSYGAGNYALSGRAYSPDFMYAWPSAKIAVMGGDQAANTLMQLKLSKMGDVSEDIKEKMYSDIKQTYDIQSDARYAAARLWVDEIIDPRETRKVLIRSLTIVSNKENIKKANFGILQT